MSKLYSDFNIINVITEKLNNAGYWSFKIYDDSLNHRKHLKTDTISHLRIIFNKETAKTQNRILRERFLHTLLQDEIKQIHSICFKYEK